ncbi:MAG TPA: D-arabinono-1,4-lactone oxidase [Myxococcota bacterium]|nr:D-arabinono-1,4-lactone oxidase [Myxococcota bacterium]
MSERWTNWSGTVSCAPHAVAAAHDEAEIAAIVHVAGREGRTVRPLGAGHSGSALCASDGVLLSLARWTGVEAVDEAAGTARVRAGTILHDLGRQLFERGLALHSLGDIDRQSLAGALATGTHGTGRTLGNLSSAAVALRFVRADGETAELDGARPADADLLRAARVSLGVLGVVTAATLRVVPAYRLHERTWRAPLDEVLARLDEWVAATRHFEFFYYPKHDFAECKAIHPTDAQPESVAGRPGERIGWSHEILPSVREEKFHEMEYSVPAAIGAACFREMAARLRTRHPEVVWPMEYRTVASDDALLSMANGRETVTISVHQDGRYAHEPVFAALEPIAVEAGGRPHWGKWHRLEASALSRVYPEWERFRAIRRGLDPGGLFLSPPLRSLLGEG